MKLFEVYSDLLNKALSPATTRVTAITAVSSMLNAVLKAALTMPSINIAAVTVITAMEYPMK